MRIPLVLLLLAARIDARLARPGGSSAVAAPP